MDSDLLDGPASVEYSRGKEFDENELGKIPGFCRRHDAAKMARADFEL